MKREEQLLENTWDLTKIYKSEEELNQDLEKAEKLVEQIVAQKGNLFKTEAAFEENINRMFEFELLIVKAYTYSHHLLDQDIANQESQKLHNLVFSKYIVFSQSLTFMTPEIMKYKDEINNYLKDEKYSDLRKYFDNIFRFSKYTLSDREEEIIALTADISSVASKAYSSLVDSEFTFADIEVDGETYTLTQGNYNEYITSQNPKIREMAFKHLYEPFKKHINTLSILYNGQINSAKFSTKVRGYENNISNALYSGNINVSVYENLVSSVNDNISVNHDYVKMRKEFLKLDQLHLYDMYVPLIGSMDEEIPYEKAKETILEAFQILGDDYTKVLEQAFENRWIDKYENEAKRSGAYSGGMYLSDPYILLNYNNKINDLYTLAHELGHSLHTYYTNKTQKYYNSSYKIFIAEVASIVNELLLTNHLLKTTDLKEKKAYILNYLLEQFRTTLIRQTMFAEFEMQTHDAVEGAQDLTSDEFNQLYYDINKKYFGEDIIIDEEIQYEWARIPHFYYNFYVYQYATSFCAAIKIANNIIEDSSFVNKYLDFLKVGDSVYPIDALKIVDIDLTKKDVIDSAMQSYADILKQFKELN